MSNTIRARIERLEAGTRPGTPTWDEFNAADNRIGARAERQLRAMIEGLLLEFAEGRPIQFTPALGEFINIPGLWRPENIERENALLAGDTEEQRQADEQVRVRWNLSLGLPAYDTLPDENDPMMLRIDAGLCNFANAIVEGKDIPQ
jgi:hypothetical protein